MCIRILLFFLKWRIRL